MIFKHIKELTALILLAVSICVSPYYYLSIQIHRNRNFSESETVVRIEMSASMYKNVVDGQKEFVMHGMMYDVKKIERIDSQYIVHAHPDRLEVELLEELAQTNGHNSGSPIHPAKQKQLFKYISWRDVIPDSNFPGSPPELHEQNDLRITKGFFTEVFIPPASA